HPLVRVGAIPVRKERVELARREDVFDAVTVRAGTSPRPDGTPRSSASRSSASRANRPTGADGATRSSTVTVLDELPAEGSVGPSGVFPAPAGARTPPLGAVNGAQISYGILGPVRRRIP